MTMRSFNNSGYAFSARHAYLLLDASGSMRSLEKSTGMPKHQAVAQMVQSLIDGFANMAELTDTYLTIYAYDYDKGEARVSPLLLEYNVQGDTWAGNTDYSKWDVLEGHGGATPIGAALKKGFEEASAWVERAENAEQRRSVIFLMTDGDNNTGDDGRSVLPMIEAFNNSTGKGRVRVATVGYFSGSEGERAEETAGRALLRELASHGSRTFFESDKADEIRQYVKDTVTAE